MPLSPTAENFKKIVDGLAPHMRGVSDFDDLTNRPLESDAIDISDLDLPMPAKPTEYPILFDETGTEYQVGWYKRASDGKVKPVWRKDYYNLNIIAASLAWTTSNVNVPTNSEYLIDFRARGADNVFMYVGGSINSDFQGKIGVYNARNYNISVNQMSLWFTKTTDEWKEV